MKNNIIRLLLFVLFASCFTSLICMTSIAKEMPVAVGLGTQYMPDISGDSVIWRNDNGNIFHKNITTGAQGSLDGRQSYSNIAISDDTIVYIDEITRKIHSYDLYTGIDSVASSSEALQLSPDVSGNAVVWSDFRNHTFDIYMKDLTTGTEAIVARVPDASHQYHNPKISGDNVVWEDHNISGKKVDILAKNLSTGLESAICTNSADKQRAAVSGYIVVWADNRAGNWDIYMKNILTGTESMVCTNPADQTLPAISGNIVVWRDSRNINWDVYMKDLATGIESAVTHNTENRLSSSPAISGTTIVWEDTRSGTFDVYMKDISLPGLSPDTPGSGIIRGRVVDQSGSAISDASVRIDNTVLKTSRTGRFTFTLVHKGAYTIYYNAPGFEEQKQTIQIEEGQDFACPTVIMFGDYGSYTGAIQGKVVNKLGEPIPWAAVRIDNIVIPTNQCGQFRFGLVHPGLYTIYYDASGYIGQVQEMIKVEYLSVTTPPTVVLSR